MRSIPARRFFLILTLVAAACLPTPDELLHDPVKRLAFQVDAFPTLMKQVAVIQCTKRSKALKRTITLPERPASSRTIPRNR